MRLGTVFLLLCAVCGCTEGLADKEFRPATGGDSSVTRQRLENARLQHHRPSPSVEWHFKEKTFVLVSHKPPLPEDLIVAILGEKSPVTKIEGVWDLNEASGELLLKNLKADGKNAREKATLKIEPRGVVRVYILGLQYNQFPGEAKDAP